MSSLLQKLGLKRRDPDSAGRQYAQHNVAGLPVTMRRAQSEIFATGSIKWQNDALSAAPTEARHGSPPNPLHYASAGAMTQSNKSVGMASDTDYKIKGLLGQGTQGKVWDAVMTRTGKAVVIKGLHKQHMTDVNSADSTKREQAKLFWRAFRNEIDILEACHHPNIVKIVGRAPDHSQLMMEKADTDLNKCLKMNKGRLTLGQCSKWFKDLLTGVAHLHSLGVTHTDLKPENLLIASDSQLKICDFGMAQRASPGTMWAVTGELSTLWYRAPELLLGCKTFGEKIDEWAVGCIAMEMLCGVTIFQGQQHGACQCRELTHRNFNSDQVGKILQVVGSPLSLAGYQCAGHIKDWPKYSRQIEPVVKKYCQAKRLPDEHPDAHGNVSKPFHSSTLWAQAIGALLVLSPDDRSTSLKVLQMPLFQNGSTPFAVSNASNSNAVSSTGVSRGGVMMAKLTPRQALTVANGNAVVMAGLG